MKQNQSNTSMRDGVPSHEGQKSQRPDRNQSFAGGCFLSAGSFILVLIFLFSGKFVLASLFGVLGIVFTFYSSNQAEQQKSEYHQDELTVVKKQLKSCNGLNPSKFFIAPDHSNVLAVDVEKKAVCILTPTSGSIAFLTSGKAEKAKFIKRTYSYTDILECELVKDGVQVTKVSRAGQAGGVLVGGALAGGVGALIGGLSASTKSSQRIKQIEMKLTVRDMKTPLYTIRFLNNSKGLDTENPEYQRAVRLAEKWNAMISILIREANEQKE